MRCLRTSIYDSPGPPTITTVARDCDYRDTLESATFTMRDLAISQGALVLTEVFEMPDDTNIADATTEGMRLLIEREQREQNQAMLYFWTVHKWEILTQGGTLFMDKPAPLTHAEIVVVLEQLARHKDYKDFRITSTDETGALITLANGKIEED